MASVSRTAQFAKVLKVLKKYYKPAPATPGRSVIEHLLFACCLEDAHHDAAEEAFAALVHTFFDWNEVRVTSISELSEVMAVSARPAGRRQSHQARAARRLRGDVHLRSGRPAQEEPRPHRGLAGETRRHDAVHRGLRGPGRPGRTRHSHRHRHDGGPARARSGEPTRTWRPASCPGWSGPLPSPRAIEFGSLLHELGADYSANPYAVAVRDRFSCKSTPTWAAGCRNVAWNVRRCKSRPLPARGAAGEIGQACGP